MNPAHIIVSRIDEQFIGHEKRIRFQGQFTAQRTERGTIEVAALLEIADPQVHMIDKPSPVKFHGEFPMRSVAIDV